MSALRARGWLLPSLIGLPILALLTFATAASSGIRSAPRGSASRPQATLLTIAQAPPDAEQSRPAAADDGPPDPTITFNFRNAPWSQVLDRFSQIAGLSLVMEVAPPGSFSYSDDRPYTVTAALDLINRVLLAKGFLLIRKQDLLILVTTDKPIPPRLVSVVEVAELAQLAENELVTLSIPLQFAAPDPLVTEIQPLLSTFGKLVPLAQAKRLLVTDLVVNLRRIHPLVVELDNAARPKPSPASPAAPAKVERILTVENVDVASLAETLRRFYTDQAEVQEFGPKTLLVQAVPDIQEKVAQLVGQIDQTPTVDEPAVEAVFPLKHLTALAFAQSLQTLFPADTRKARFTADAANNAVVAVAPESVHATVRSLIAELDRPSPSEPVVKSYVPKHVSVDPLLSTLQTLFAGEPIRFTTDLGRQRIIATAPPAVHAKIAAMVEELDQSSDDGAARSEHVYRMKHAKASTFAAMLQTLYPSTTTAARFSSGGADDLLIVVASDSLQASVRRLLDEVDQPPTETTVDRTYTPKHVRSETLLATLQSLYGSQPATRFTTDPRGETVIISAPADVQQKIEAMLPQLDQEQDPERTPVSRFYRLEHASGGTLIGPLQTLFPESTQRARFSHDAANNALIVAAPAAIQEEIAASIRQMDQPPESARRVDRVYELRRADPQAVLSSLQTLYGSQASFVADPANRAVIVSAPEPLQTKITAIVEQLDKAPRKEGPPVEYRVYSLRFATPEALATALMTVFEDHPGVRILSDATNRSLVVVAPAELQTVIGEMVADADQDNQSARTQEKIYNLTHAATPDLVATLQTLYGADQGVRITPGPKNQSIIVVGPNSVHRRVESMLTRLDQAQDSTQAPISRGYPLANAQADSIASALQAQFGSLSGVTITADRSTNAVIVMAPARPQIEIAEVIRQLDEPAAATRRSDRVYAIEHADPRALLSSLQTLYGPQARFVEDGARRLIIVNATEATQEKIAALIEQFDVPQAGDGTLSQHVYRLRFANSPALASALQSLYPSRTDVRIVADPQNGSLVVVAPADVQDAIGLMVAEADQSPRGRDLTERLYRPKHVAASSLLSTLSNLYAPPQGTARFSTSERGEAVIAVAEADEQTRIAATVETLDQPPDPASRRVAKSYPLGRARPETVTAALQGVYPPGQGVQVMPGTDTATVTVIASGAEHERIAELVGDLDASGRAGEAMTQRTYRLQFASPDSLVTALQSLYQDRRDVRIVPDSQNRSLLVVASPEVQEAIAELVLQSDQESRQSGLAETVFRPEHVDAASLVPTLSSLYSPPNGTAHFSVHAGGQALVIVAAAQQQERIAQTLKLLDQPADPQTQPVAKVYRLENTSRDSVVTALQTVYAGNQRVQIAGGVDAAAVTVVAPTNEQERIAALVEDMDQPVEAGADRTVEVIDLVEVDPFTAESTIRDMYRSLPQAQVPFVGAQFEPERLVVRATSGQVAEIKRLLVQMGEDPSLMAAPNGREQTVRTIRVRQGSPRTVAVAIEKLWPRLRRNPLRVVAPSPIVPNAQPSHGAQAHAGPKQNGDDAAKRESLPGDPSKPVVITVTASNLIVASDDAEALNVVERLTRSLTEIPDPDQGDFTVFYLETADAVTLAETIDVAFNGPIPAQGSRRTRDERVRVVASEETGAIIVRAAPADLVGVQEMIQSLDTAHIAGLGEGDVHIIPLKQAKASEVAEILRQIYADYITQGTEGPARTRGFTASRARRGGGPSVSVSVGVDARSNSLVISAPEDLFAQMQTLVNGLETAAADSTRQYRVTPLDRANSLDVREALDILLQRDRGTSAPQSRPRGEQRRRQRDSSRSSRGTSSIEPNRSAPLTGVAAGTIAGGTSVSTIRVDSGHVEVSHRSRIGAGGRNIPKEDRSSPLRLASFEDTEAQEAQQPIAPDAPLVNGEPPVVPSPEGRLSDLAEVDALPDLNVILLWGTDRDLEILGEIVEQIERLAEQRQLAFRLVPLHHVKASRLADLLDELYSGIVNARGTATRTELEARVIALAKPNAVLLAAPQNDLDQLAALVSELDQPVSPSTQFRVFRLAHASVGDLSQVIRGFFSGRTADGELAVEMVVTPDPRSNSMVVMASPRDMAEVVRLVGDLDIETTASVNQMRVFRLENSEAGQLAAVLQQAIQGTQAIQGAGAAAAQSVMLRLLRPDRENGRFVESGILENVRITANPGANTLVVSAPPRTLGLISELIAELDVLPSTAVEIKVFTLEHSDAQRMGETLQTLFIQVEGFGGQIAPSPAEQSGLSQSTSSPLVQLSFSVDMRTNSLLVSGSPAQLEVVEAIIIRLDGSDAQERQTAVYRLKNATAAEVAAALSTFLERQLLQRLQQTGVVSPTEILERDVVVVPEAVTNSLLISAVPRFFPELKTLIEQLDDAPPQVVIQVLIAQVTLTDDEEFGLELGIQDSVLFQRGIFPGTATLAPTFVEPGITISSNQTPGVPGFNFNNQPLGNNPNVSPGNLGGQALSHFGVGRVGADGIGGLVLAASSESISILLRALKAQGRVDVLSRPQITTLDNQEAFIQIGQKVPIVTNSVITGNGSVINPVNFQDVGIILLVTPKINPDGTIVMRVGPEISRLSESTVEVSTGVFAPIIDTTRAETTVSAIDGQTVVIGGLITDIKNSQHRRVPLLGDIPILEWAFRFDQNNCEKRELLILMTPHVVRSPADAERIKQIETERMDWVEEEVEAVHGPIYGIPADGSPETDPLLLDEFPATEDGGTDPYFSSAETVTSGENPTAVSPKATSNTPELLPAGAQGISEKRDGSPERKQRQGGRLWNLFRRGKE